jgi:hypothetical protein
MAEYSVNQRHWIYFGDTMVSDKMPHCISRVIWEATEINLHHYFTTEGGY